MNKLRELISTSSVPIPQIAEKVGIQNERLEAILAGIDPTLSEFRKIADFFGKTLQDFLEENPLHKEVKIKFRQNLIRKDNAYVESSNFFADKIASTLELIGDSNSSYAWASQFSAKDFTYIDAEAMAYQFRATFCENDHLSPLFSLPKICIEKLGILLFIMQNAEFEGASTVLGGYPFTFISARTFRPRMLFTLAHELGHLLVHQCKENFSVIDSEKDIESWPTQRTASEKTEEYFVDAFASCLLMPSEGVGVTLKKIRECIKEGDRDSLGDVEILYLARIYGVSFLTAAIRCENLKLMPVGSAMSMYQAIKKNHVSPEKRAEDLGLPPRYDVVFPEVSDTILSKVRYRIKRGDISVGRASSILGISILDLFNLNKVVVH